MRKKVLYNEDDVKNMVMSSASMHEAAKKLNIPMTTFKRICIKLGIYAPATHWDSTLFMHSDKARQTLANNNLNNLNKVLSGEVIFTGQSKSLKDRLVRFNILPDVCSECGIGNEWNNKPITLQLDHIDGNHNNNVLANLRIVCPNCHSQTTTFAGRNITTKNMDRFSDIENKIKTLKPTSISDLLRKLGVKPSSHYYAKVNTIIVTKKIRTKIRKKCIKCDAYISHGAKHGLCKKCIHISQRKAERPTKETMIELLRTNPIVSIAKMYSVSDKAIVKWLISYGLPNKRNEIKTFLSTLNS